MGEYAEFRGERVKIGTCEDMYYLRHDQRHRVSYQPGNVDPVKDAASLRFRFPFPDEDSTSPGHFENYGRSIPVHGVTAPVGVNHSTVQFVASAGYLVSLPCPEGPDFPESLHFHRNGFRGAVLFGQQKPSPDGSQLWLIGECGGCGSKWRYETWEEVEPVVVSLRSEADRRPDSAPFYHALADRIAAGYVSGVEAVTA